MNMEVILFIVSCIIGALVCLSIVLVGALIYHYIDLNYEDIREEIDMTFDYVFRGTFGYIVKMGIWAYLSLWVFLETIDWAYNLLEPLFK